MTKANILSQIKKAEEDTRTMISEANEAKAKKVEKEKMLKEGITAAESIKSKANSNVAKATEYLVEQFERSMHA